MLDDGRRSVGRLVQADDQVISQPWWRRAHDLFRIKGYIGQGGSEIFSATLPSPVCEPPGVQVTSDAWWLPPVCVELIVGPLLRAMSLGATGLRAMAAAALRAVAAGLGTASLGAGLGATGLRAMAAAALRAVAAGLGTAASVVTA